MSALETQGDVALVMDNAEGDRDSIDRWLSVLVRLLHVSKGQRGAIRDEVESHLRERVRDLIISGGDENESIRTAIAELGEVADLARRFSRAAKSRTRRIIMNMGLIGVGAMGIATATFLVGGPQADTQMAVIEMAPPAGGLDGNTALDKKVLDVAFSGQSLEEVLRFAADTAGVDLVLNRRSLEDAGIALDEEVELDPVRSQNISQVLRLVGQQLEEPFDWRVADGVMEVASRETFDRRTVALASFDVDEVLELINMECNDLNAAGDRLVSLITEYVEPDAWQCNGGELGQISIVGGKMFVKAPSRFQGPIKWILGQLEENADEARAPQPTGLRSAVALDPWLAPLPAATLPADVQPSNTLPVEPTPGTTTDPRRQ